MSERKTVNVAAAVIIDNEKVFSCQRGYGEFKGKWEFPGGKIEKGETSEEALKREIKEELQIDINILKFLTDIKYSYENFDLDMDCYLSEISSGTVNLEEHSDSKWLSREELDSVDWIEADIDAVKILKTLL